MGDCVLGSLTIAGLGKAKERALEQNLRLVLHTPGQCCVQVWISTCERRWTRPIEIGAVISTCACCDKAGHEKARSRFRHAKCSNCGKTGHLRATYDVRILLASQVPRAAVARVLAKAARVVEAQTSAVVVDRSVIDDLIALVDTRVAASVASVVNLSQVCRSSGGNANARSFEVEPAEAKEESEIQHVGTFSL